MRVVGRLALASLQRLWSRVGREQQKRSADFGMSRVPSAQLHDVEEQEAAPRPCDLQEILPRLQDSHASQRDEIVGNPPGEREIRSVAQLVEHRSPKPGVAGSSPASPAIEASC